MTETYINAPLPYETACALKKQAKENGRAIGRELAYIAIRALARKAKAHANDKASKKRTNECAK